MFDLFARVENKHGVITVGSQGVKIAFRPENGDCSSCSIDGTCSARQSEPAPAAAWTTRVVLVNRSPQQLQYRRHLHGSSIGTCNSCSTDGTCSIRQSKSAPAAAQTVCLVFINRSQDQLQHKRLECFQLQPAPAAAQTARAVFVGQSLHQPQHRRYRE